MLEFLPQPIRSIAKGTIKIIVLVGVILYVLSPIDLLPEAILGPLGLIDDLVVILFGASFLGFDLLKSAKGMKKNYHEGGK